MKKKLTRHVQCGWACKNKRTGRLYAFPGSVDVFSIRSKARSSKAYWETVVRVRVTVEELPSKPRGKR